MRISSVSAQQPDRRSRTRPGRRPSRCPRSCRSQHVEKLGEQTQAGREGCCCPHERRHQPSDALDHPMGTDRPVRTPNSGPRFHPLRLVASVGREHTGQAARKTTNTKSPPNPAGGGDAGDFLSVAISLVRRSPSHRREGIRVFGATVSERVGGRKSRTRTRGCRMSRRPTPHSHRRLPEPPDSSRLAGW
jgi:hypothetical protein